MRDEHRVVLELRNQPRYRVMNYLVEAGGTPDDVASVTAPRWAAFIESLEPDTVGIVEIPRDRLVIWGERTEVERVGAFLRRHTTRGG